MTADKGETMITRKIVIATVVVFVGVFFTVAETLAQAKSKPKVTYYSVRPNTVMKVKMDETVTSKTARKGDEFTVTLAEPVYSSGGVVLAPTGSKIMATITSVKKAVRDGEPGMIDVRFTRLVLPNKRAANINGSLTSLDEGDTKSDNEGGAKVSKTRRRNLKFIGGGGGGGALIGALAGGGKGALIGGIIGAGGGLLAKLATKGDDAVIKKGNEFGVIVNRGFSLPRYRGVR